MSDALTIHTNMPADRRNNIGNIIQDYTRRLMGFIRRRVSSEADAEDILQDVFYQFAGETEPIEQVSAWLFRVTRNKITDRQRKKKPELIEDIYGSDGDEDFLGWAELFFDNTGNPETEHLRNLFWQTLNAALDELPKEQRDVFIMNEMEDIPFKKISEQTGVAVNTLISRKRYAVLHLRERLATLRDELLNY